MWAILENEIVIGCIPPDAPIEDVQEISKTHLLVLMTEENSPAWAGAKYKNGKFIKGDE
jgi:hypothetical protein